MKFFRCVALPLIALLLGAGSAMGDNNRSVISLTLTESDYGGGRIYLPVRIANVLGVMRLDTGASITRVRLAPWNQNLPSLGQIDSTGASGRTTRCDEVEARDVELKATQGNGVGRAKYQMARCAAGDGDDLLGLSFFKGARFTLDFPSREMAFIGDAPAGAAVKPFRLLGPDGRLVGIDLRAGNATAVGLFDTGAEICAVDRKFVEKHKDLFVRVKRRGKASEVGGRQFSSRLYKIRELDLGEGRVLRGVYALAYDFGVLREALGAQTPFILGYNLISRFNWELDFRTPTAPTWSAKPN